MRIVCRCFGISMILIMSVLLFLQMMDFNVRRDELTSCISTAMSNTQIIMQEQIEDQINGTNTRRKTISSNEEYLEEYANNFNKLVTSNSDFDIHVYGIDYTKGFLDIEITSSFTMFNGKTKTITSRKTGIVEVLQDGGDEVAN